jgi:hypothetical protein
MWYFVGLFFAFFAALVATYWGTSTPPQDAIIPWLFAGMGGSAAVAFVMCARINLKEARKERKP